MYLCPVLCRSRSAAQTSGESGPPEASSKMRAHVGARCTVTRLYTLRRLRIQIGTRTMSTGELSLC